MSGGFFRGTSADQDTRFSNKQAKLLKSQKFPPELDHPVDMSKVKMDVIKPWIAHRVTELLGFEDEVLINFIYGLLEEQKGGKEVQIQITGFMEKNTGKFMKELWGLLLSAQNNASGVPQQFLDAKEEEIRKKKVETDRITHEIQKKKELEQEKRKKMDEEVDISKAVDDASNRVPKHSSAQREDDNGSGERNGLRGKTRSSRSPYSAEHPPSADRMNRSRSISKSFSNSRSYSESLSRSPQSRGRSISPDRRYRSPRKHSLSPRRKYSPRRPRSPLRRRSPYSRRRSSSYSRRRSPSPRRRRSPSPVMRRSPPPRRRRSPTPVRRRSPTPIRRGSPSIVRRRSPSPVRRRSPPPMRRRSPSLRRRSPSPVRRRSPIGIRRRSPSPSRYRSPSPPHRRSPTPVRRRSPSPVRRRSPPRSPRQRRRSPLRSPRQKYGSGSPYRSRSPANRRRRSMSRDHDVRSNGMISRRHRDDYLSERPRGRKYPSQTPEREGVEHSGQGHKGLDPVTHQPPITLRSPQRDPRDRSDAGRKRPALLSSRGISPSQSGSSLQTGKSSPSEDLRTSSLSEGPTRNTRERAIRADSASPARQTRHLGVNDTVATVRGEGTRYSRVDKGQRTESPPKRIRHSPRAGGNRNIPTKDLHHEEYSPERLADRKLAVAEHRPDDIEIRRKDRDKKSEKHSSRIDRSLSPTKNSSHMMEDVEDGPGRVEVKRFLPDNARDEHPSAKQRNSPSPKRLQKPYSREDYQIDEKKHSHSRNIVDSGLDSENEKIKSKDMERRKHKRQDKHHMASDDDTSYDSHVDERKEAKRRKKEEKKLRKEEKRRRREERHRRREERRAGKLKAKTVDTVTLPSDVEKNRSDADDSDDHIAAKIDSHPSDIEETVSEQKKLEIELRKKALESLRAKKAINP